MLNFQMVGLKHDLNIGVVEHVFEETCISMLRHELVAVGEVAVVAVGACRDARRDRLVELGWIYAPLLFRIAPKELLVEVTPDFADDDVFGGSYLWQRFRPRGEPALHLLRRQRQPIELVDGIKIDGDGEELSVYLRQDPMLVESPLRELREMIEDHLRVGVKDMRPIAMDEDARIVVVVVCVAADVGSAIDQHNALVAAGSDLARDHASGKSGTDDQPVKHGPARFLPPWDAKGSACAASEPSRSRIASAAK